MAFFSQSLIRTDKNEPNEQKLSHFDWPSYGKAPPPYECCEKHKANDSDEQYFRNPLFYQDEDVYNSRHGVHLPLR